jgi:hypothetical protein
MWLSILPTEPGWYWLRKLYVRDSEIVLYVCQDSQGGNFIALGWGTDYDKTPTDKIEGQWQGPITPKEPK